jgi:hypothetical protein
MPRKISKLRIVTLQLANARRIVAEQQGLVAELRAAGHPTVEVEGTLRTYLSALTRLEAHECKLREDATAKKGESLSRRDRRRSP